MATGTTMSEVAARKGSTVPVLTLLAGLLVLWYGGAIFLNAAWQRDLNKIAGQEMGTLSFIGATWSQEKPKLPAPHQVVIEIYDSTVGALREAAAQEQPRRAERIYKRSLVHHAWVTLSATLLGFGIGTALGILLAVLIVHFRVLELSLMPWVIVSQTIPILALAPMLVVVMNAIGIQGLIPKAIISSYLSFFPVAVGMVKGLRSPDRLQLDLMHSYAASPWQVLVTLRLPAAVPYLFAALKVAIAISLVGAIVAELPAGSQAGIGVKLLAGSYYSQTLVIWAALIVAALMAGALVALLSVAERLTLNTMGFGR